MPDAGEDDDDDPPPPPGGGGGSPGGSDGGESSEGDDFNDPDSGYESADEGGAPLLVRISHVLWRGDGAQSNGGVGGDGGRGDGSAGRPPSKLAARLGTLRLQWSPSCLATLLAFVQLAPPHPGSAAPDPASPASCDPPAAHSTKAEGVARASPGGADAPGTASRDGTTTAWAAPCLPTFFADFSPVVVVVVVAGPCWFVGVVGCCVDS